MLIVFECDVEEFSLYLSDLEDVPDDYDEDEDDDDDDDDSMYEFEKGKNSLHRKRGLKRNASGYAAGSYHNYEIALGER